MTSTVFLCDVSACVVFCSSLDYPFSSGATENVWHILNVQPNSPASKGGLISDQDYIIGADSVFSDLAELVGANNMKPLKFHVYNSAMDSSREAIVTPNGGWGGEGSMGCELGFGYLHRIPAKQVH